MGSLDQAVAGERRRVLFVDAFDSFTNNIVGLLEQCLDVEVALVHINDKEAGRNLENLVDEFDAVVVGPGPGHPESPVDIGFIGKLWELNDAHILPVLGICLGFQSLCFSQGARIKQLAQARHGIVSRITHRGEEIFHDITNLEATQYHSLSADIYAHGEMAHISWEPSPTCPKLQPLAWDADDELNGPILMGVKHTTLPFWGVQFHPESICTSVGGQDLIKNWWVLAQKWLHRRGRQAIVKNGPQVSRRLSRHSFSFPNSVDDGAPIGNELSHAGTNSPLAKELYIVRGSGKVVLRWAKQQTNSYLSPPRLLEALGHGSDEVVMLDSQGHASGRYSILGLTVPGKTVKVVYDANRELRYGVDGQRLSTLNVGNSIENIWPILQGALDSNNPRAIGSFLQATAPDGDGWTPDSAPDESPFWGGFMGYISYEACLETIDVTPGKPCVDPDVPTIHFAFIHRSIVIDHETSEVYIQSLLPEDDKWILETRNTIDHLARNAKDSEAPITALNGHRPRANTDVDEDGPGETAALDHMLSKAQIDRPAEATYRNKVLQCQDKLASGDSYELCLTDETEIFIPSIEGKGLGEWALYKRLRRNNPAPFGAFVRLSDSVVVGSSPERFLRWTRNGRCQFRPIKGTVKKGPEMSREQAHKILGSSKERAENLMIVDLIRHDLSGVIGADKTWVSKLMVVEEYETVYQLVSVIEGQLPPPAPEAPRGLHVLKASLPPGSMTGAPKKRSCEILSEIEQRPRGIYSGVLGYLDVGGAGDFSVVIRTAMREGKSKRRFRQRDDAQPDESGSQGEVWRVGAGGAVTIQSTDEGEFLEMETKQSSVLSSLLKQKK